ncbi:transcriptional regulator [Corallococcus exercitus]|uniref:Transcriptional regulator n=2 Tax=Corallococcus exercitus TaxID=2316736 RepID=A0A7Y4KSB6_9BACT|nr:ATP-binding protein [Corallococcus exercitus]NOK38460.1 transcriptional regulator [Corallococcus exercitus]
MIPDLARLAARGESVTLELKRSTGELREAMHTLCAFANGQGGRVLLGVKPGGELIGQQVSEQTLHDIATARERFEPPLDLHIQSVEVAEGRSVLVLTVGGISDSVPYTFDGRAYERVGNTTRKMAQERYELLLLERAHSRRRWENQEADEVPLQELDREEVLRIVEAARSAGRLVGPVGRGLPELLDRLGVRHRGRLLRAAVVLFGKTFLPHHPQCELRMARFRGTDKTEFLDQRNVRGPAFRLLEEAELFCQRHFPLAGRIEPGRLQRVDRPLIPPDAMRELLVNAFIHRDYSIAGGAVSLAIFDDRVEIWSAGRYPKGITPESLTRPHLSVQRNPIIAEVFYRAGLIEKWGRGTNRVAEMCRAAGLSAPEFAEVTGAVVVTLRVSVGQTLAADRGELPSNFGEPTADWGEFPSDRGELPADWGEFAPDRGELPADWGELGAQEEIDPQAREIIKKLGLRPRKAALREAILTLTSLRPWHPAELARVLRFSPDKLTERHLKEMLEEGLLERTHPDNPKHPAQAYRAVRRDG